MIQYQAQHYGSHSARQQHVQQAIPGRSFYPQHGVQQHSSGARSGHAQQYVQQGYDMPAAEKSVHLDRIVATNKNMRDASLIDMWLNNSIKIMQRVKLDPLPEDKYTGTSEAGTDLSQAYTANDVVDTQRKPLDEACPSPPDSPPWRAANEGGRLAMEPPPGTLHLDPTPSFAHQHFLENDQASTGGSNAKSSTHPSIDTPKHPHDPPHDPRSRTPVAAAPPPDAAMKQVTLGVTLGKRAGEGEGLPVLRLKHQGPLALHGALSVGDRVLKIDGEELEGLSAVELNRLVVGPEGSVAEVRFVRAADARTPPQEECVYVTRLAPLAPKSNNPFGVVRAPPAR